MTITLPGNLQSPSSTDPNALKATSASEASDRFLKLLVAQMQNQDPLNPLDNAEVTTQMAQISTVTGIEELNATTAGLNAQFIQLQAMQSTNLIGHDVAIEGDVLRVRDGQGDGGFEISATATNAKVEIMNAAGRTIGTIDMTDLAAGRHSFQYEVPAEYRDEPLHFKVTATSGSATVDSMTLAHQRVQAVSTFGDTLALELANGDRVAYDAVWAVL